MAISTLFFIFLSVAIFGIVFALSNIGFMFKREFDDRPVHFGAGIVRHIVATMFYVIGAIGALITGIIWIVHQFAK